MPVAIIPEPEAPAGGVFFYAVPDETRERGVAGANAKHPKAREAVGTGGGTLDLAVILIDLVASIDARKFGGSWRGLKHRDAKTTRRVSIPPELAKILR